MSLYPEIRMRRVRQSPALRRMLDMEPPGPGRFIWPVFVVPGSGVQQPLDSLPGQFRFSPDRLVEALKPVHNMGIGGILVFGVVPDANKTDNGCAAWEPDGPAVEAVRAVREHYPDMAVFTDVCLCGYTRHAHCGLLDASGDVDNDATLAPLARMATTHAKAGATAVCPSAMMDGQVQAIRQALDTDGFNNTMIMSYSTKFASGFYGPFREAGGSSPRHGDRRGYQASYGDSRRGLLESALDEAEGADILMVKPALAYLDVIARLRERTNLPLAAYNVSGEYAMLHATAERGWGDLHALARESIMGIARAGAEIIISYWANQYDQIMG